MTTEDEARTKWCPFARDMVGAGGNRVTYGGGEEDGPDSDECAHQFAAEMAAAHPCIASACMAWRWGEDRDTGRIERHIKNLDGGRQTVETRKVMERTGHCGLAGQP